MKSGGSLKRRHRVCADGAAAGVPLVTIHQRSFELAQVLENILAVVSCGGEIKPADGASHWLATDSLHPEGADRATRGLRVARRSSLSQFYYDFSLWFLPAVGSLGPPYLLARPYLLSVDRPWLISGILPQGCTQIHQLGIPGVAQQLAHRTEYLRLKTVRISRRAHLRTSAILHCNNPHAFTLVSDPQAFLGSHPRSLGPHLAIGGIAGIHFPGFSWMPGCPLFRTADEPVAATPPADFRSGAPTTISPLQKERRWREAPGELEALQGWGRTIV
ncbi:hypothetical protein B0H13DRAFT_2369082 [Mycena leptocephala]|nr:hypothetical protein B0H13DRAFT_2369082 [Mycena leptocephala]